MIYDIIGDIHGQADKLTGLLTKLGYHHNGQFWQAPPNHQAIFLGDFIDRGDEQLATLAIVFKMIDSGQALAVMGNHEYNAIAYATEYQNAYCRTHSDRNQKQHQAFLDAVGFGSDLHAHWIERFYELPLWLDLPDFGVVHACWHKQAMMTLTPHLTNCRLNPQTFADLHHTPDIRKALNQLLNGLEVIVPEPQYLIDGQGIKRNNMRIAWWQDCLDKPLLQISAASNCDVSHINADLYVKIDFEFAEQKPIFIGHYWLKETPAPLGKQVICTDYSAGTTGFLTAYQFDSDNPTLSNHNFVQYYHQ